MRSRQAWGLALVTGLVCTLVGATNVSAAVPPLAYDSDMGTFLADHEILAAVGGQDGALTDPILTFELSAPSHGVLALEGDVECHHGFPVGNCYQPVRYTPDAGYVGPDSFTFTVTAENGLSDTGTVTFTLVSDETPPSGDLFVFSVNGDAGGGFTNTTDLLVRAQANDNFGLDKLRLSNSGATSGGMLTTYIESDYSAGGWPDLVPWQTSNSTGGTNSQGTKTVYAQWSDLAGNWTPVKLATIKLDTTPASVTAVTIGFATSAANSGVPIRISFTTSEAGAYFMQRSVDGGAYSPMNYGIDSKKLDLGHSTSHSYRYRVRIRDGAGNWSPWKYSITFKPASSSQNSSAIAYSGSWSAVTYVGTGWQTRRSKTAGNSAKYTFTGKGVAWQAIKGPGRGKAQVYIDGTLVKTVDLYRSKYATEFVYSKTWSSSAKHTIRIRVLGTSGRPYVDIDGFGVLK
jgi:Bacterial Ig domain